MTTWFTTGPAGAKTAVVEDWWHGSASEQPFTRFDLTKDKPGQGGSGAKHWNSHLGTHLSSDHATAARIGFDNGSHVYHVRTDMQNPKHYDSEYDLDHHGYRWAIDNGHLTGDRSATAWWAEGALRNAPNVREIASGFKRHLQDQGHDGVTYGNEFEGPKGHKCAITFHPDDAKITEHHYPGQPCSEGTPCPECDYPHPKQFYGDCENCGEHLDWHDQHPARGEHGLAAESRLTDAPTKEDRSVHDRAAAPGEGGQGGRGLGDPRGGHRGAASRPRRLAAGPGRGPGEGTGGDGAPGALSGPVTWHPQAAKDMKRLDGPVRKQMQETIDRIVSGDPTAMAQTHPLGMALKGWNATKGSRGHRVVHRPNDQGGIHIGYVGLHEYDKAIQRLTSKEWPTKHVPLEELPVQDENDPHREGPDVHPYPISYHDDPKQYVSSGAFKPGMTFSLKHVPLAHFNVGGRCPTGVHSAECYDVKHLDRPNSCCDNMSESDFNDADYVRDLAKTPEKLPALVSIRGETHNWGGGHRLAAWHEAGWTHAPVWVPDEHHKEAVGSEGALPEGLTIRHDPADLDDLGWSDHRLTAYVPTEKTWLNPEGKRDVGRMYLDARHDWHHQQEGKSYDGPRRVSGVSVDADYRRRGVATALWDHAKSLGLNPAHDDGGVQFPDGKAWAEKTAGANGDLPDLEYRHHPKVLGWQQMLSAVTPEGEPVGKIRWADYDSDKIGVRGGEVIGVSVKPEHRRRGVASELFRRAREIDPRVHHSDVLTDDGHAWSDRTTGLS